jgi:hypothetical protein
MSIDIADLLPGDLVFPYTGTDLATSVPGHVMIVGKADRMGIATQIHQVAKSMTNSIAETGSQRERLVPNSAKAAGVSGTRKGVLRCKDDALRSAAAALALTWQSYLKLGFADVRRNHAVLFETKHANRMARVAELQQHFFQTGMFRAIKYAARRKGYLCYPGESGESGQGMFCSMFVVICYQVAGISNYVHPAEVSNPLLRVSDKKMSHEDLESVKKAMSARCDDKELNHYVRHTLALKERNHYRLADVTGTDPKPKQKGLHYQPSISYWDFRKAPSIAGFDWASHITLGMMVDAKVVMPQGLYDSLAADEAGWQDMGDLTGRQDFEQSADIKERAQAHHQEMMNRQKGWLTTGLR